MHIHKIASRLLTLIFATCVGVCGAQQIKLAPTSRTVYKCTVAGKVVYTDEPCLGARLIHVEPTRGMDQDSGKRRIGADINNERMREGLAEAIRPITGMDRQQLDKATRRRKLEPAASAECAKLDDSIAVAERSEHSTAASDRSRIEQKLLQERLRQKKLGC
jgi:hypothetical protein